MKHNYGSAHPSANPSADHQLGRWVSASLVSIAGVCLYIVALTYYEIGIPISAENMKSYATVFGIFLAGYIVFSLLGWLLIGLPVHWLLCKLKHPYFFIYPAISIIIFSMSTVLLTLESAAIFGIAATLQATLFRLFVFHRGATMI